MVSRLSGMGIFGMDAFPVTVEADLSRGLPSFEIVGLPDAAVREARDRVRAAIHNCGFSFPVSRITVNLAPADLRKEGSFFDFPILLSILAASGELSPCDLSDSVFIGELSLSGELKSIRGILPMVIGAKEAGFRKIYLPKRNEGEAASIPGIEVYPLSHVTELLNHLRGAEEILPAKPPVPDPKKIEPLPDFSEVRGQENAKRALEIAASGGHNILMIGPPGSGKSMLAKRLPSILPDMTSEEQIEVSKIYSVAGYLQKDSRLLQSRPFRAPHHSVSAVGLSGGGSIPHPGDISLAHNGILFLDELPEFGRESMEVLRQPLEDGTITISRSAARVTYPCRTMFVAAMNPCPCGYFGHPTHPCTCSPAAVSRYMSRVSGPLLDRIDIHIEIPPVEFSDLTGDTKAESSAEVRKRVCAARELQLQRFKDTGITCNAGITPDLLRKVCPMTDSAKNVLKHAFERFGLSARAFDRVLKVSRSIADLEQSEQLETWHVAEAVQYRTLDRKYWTTEL